MKLSTASKVTLDWSRLALPDGDSTPHDYLFQDADYREADQARLDAFNRDDWHFVGIKAQLTLGVVSDAGHYTTLYTVTSSGLWGIESDSDESYLQSTYEEQKTELLDALRAISDAFTDKIPLIQKEA